MENSQTVITITKQELEALLTRAAKRGADEAIAAMVIYTYTDAAKKLGICYNTLKKHIVAGKIKSIDGRITGAEIQRYLRIDR